jgi:hypothetical protein
MLLADGVRWELEEDLSTAWVPDALDWFDIDALGHGARALAQETAALSIPRPDGGSLTVYPLPVDLLLRLHRSVDQLRHPADAALAPSVCGYRRGSEPGEGYRKEHTRFVDFIRAGLESHPYTGTADVAAFFSCVSYDLTLLAVDRVDPESTAAVAPVLKELASAGVIGLPPGYGDARLLSNLVLALADTALQESSFCRWIDDYRIFGASRSNVDLGIDRLTEALAMLKLRLNTSKTRTLRSEAMRTKLGRPLESVFHPEQETGPHTLAALRAVFSRAVADPLNHRREIRFSLRRMAKLGDPLAIDFALHGLVGLPWELPRLIDYLACFVDDPRVHEAVGAHVVKAAKESDDWRMARLLPLAIAMGGLTEDVVSSVAFYADRTRSPATWGLALRFLSLAGFNDALDLGKAELDPRAVLAAYADFQAKPPVDLVARSPETAAMLACSAAPPPSPHSIL